MNDLSDSRFYNGQYSDALQYTKDILKSSSSIDEIITNVDNIKHNNEDKENISENKWSKFLIIFYVLRFYNILKIKF